MACFSEYVLVHYGNLGTADSITKTKTIMSVSQSVSPKQLDSIRLSLCDYLRSLGLCVACYCYY